MVLSSIDERSREKVDRFFSKDFDPDKVAEGAAISYITKLGTLEDRIQAIDLGTIYRIKRWFKTHKLWLILGFTLLGIMGLWWWFL